MTTERDARFSSLKKTFAQKFLSFHFEGEGHILLLSFHSFLLLHQIQNPAMTILFQ